MDHQDQTDGGDDLREEFGAAGECPCGRCGILEQLQADVGGAERLGSDVSTACARYRGPSTMIDMTEPAIPNDCAATACCGGGTSRLDLDEAASLAGRLSAIADPVRLQMLSIIASSSTGEVCACDFVGPIGKSQPTVSHHLKVLNEAGLVDGDKRGRWIWYRLAPGAVDDIVGTLVTAISSDST